MYKTGDLGRWLENGSIDYLGRNDFQVKLRGQRIELGEIEASLRGADGVRDAVVVLREDTPGDQRLVAYLLGDSAVPTPADLRTQLSAVLPEHMVPSAFVTLDAFPLTANGKLDRKALPAPDRTALASRTYEAPQGEVEQAIATIWQELLGVERVGRHDNFFGVGGHSLLAVQFSTRLREAMGFDISLRNLFASPVLSDLAVGLSGAARSALAPLLPVDRTAPLRLSLAQQRLWLLCQFDHAASTAYHMPASLRLRGVLDKAALRCALDRIVARHEILRTTFVEHEDGALQVVAPPRPFALATRDLRHLHGQDQEAAVARYAADEAAAPFDLGAGPLIRGQLLQLGEHDHILLVTQHHIITDAWSIGLLVREFSALYGAFHDNRPDPLPPLAVQYSDYAAWQRGWLNEQLIAGHVEFWRHQLAGIPTLLELPTDRPRPAMQTYAGAQVPIHLDATLSGALRALAKRHGATLFMTVLTGWATLLARLSGQDDIVVGTSVANRQHPQAEPLIGFFVNTVALRVSFNAEPTAATLLDQVKATVLQALAHQDIPFEQVVEVVNPERSAAHNPLFQSLFALNNTPGATLALPDLELSTLGADRITAHFDLSLTLTEVDDVLTGTIDYAIDLFDAATVQRFAGYFTTLLEAMVAEPDRTLATVALLSETERHRLLVEFNETATEFPGERLVHELFAEQAARRPDAVAVISEEHQLSYGALNVRANQLAHYLIAQGVGPDTRVALCVERSLDMIVGLLGILKAGAAYVPLDPVYPSERLAYMLADSTPVLLVTQQAASAALAPAALPVLVLDSDVGRSLLDAQPTRDPDSRALGVDASNLAYVIYTSGSTGRAKGVMVEHRSLVNFWQMLRDTIYAEVPAHSTVALNAAFSFDMSMKGILQLLSGHCLLLVPQAIRANGPDFVRLLERYQVAAFDCTPAQMEILDQAGLLDLPDYRPRSVLLGGEAIHVNLWRKMAQASGTRFFNMYGPTEATIDATFGHIGPSDTRPHIGKPLANASVYILDPHGQPVPPGVTGELFIGGTGVARGYLNRPDLTAERFMPDPFSRAAGARMYRTGDLGRWLSDGTIEYLGRNDFQVKLRGFRIELGEIESELSACAGVRAAVVLAREDTPGDKRLVAYVVPSEGETPAVADLRAALAAALPDYMVPAAFVRLDALPLTPNGKLDRKALPAPDQSSVAMQNYEAPLGPVETAIATIWQEILGVERVGRNDHFFELGGHSLLAVQFVVRAKASALEFTLGDLLTCPRVSQLATRIDIAQPLQRLVPIREEGTRAPLFLVHPAGGEPGYASRLGAALPADLPVFGISAAGLSPGEQPFEEIEAMAAAYVAEIRAVQPRGPYFVAGWSFGGIVAYEIATQLLGVGETVGFVGMYDSGAPIHRSAADLLQVDEVTALMTVTGHEPQATLDLLTPLAAARDLDGMILVCRRLGLISPDIDEETVYRYLRVCAANLRAKARYLPTRNGLAVTMFCSADAVNTDQTLGWGALLDTEITVYNVPGNHVTMVQTPHVHDLAQATLRAIEAAGTPAEAVYRAKIIGPRPLVKWHYSA
jgi:amino acid adenylation domain-containing protein